MKSKHATKQQLLDLGFKATGFPVNLYQKPGFPFQLKINKEGKINLLVAGGFDIHPNLPIYQIEMLVEIFASKRTNVYRLLAKQLKMEEVGPNQWKREGYNRDYFVTELGFSTRKFKRP